MTAPPAAVVAAFRRQAGLCDAYAAPFYAELCRRCADNVERGGPLATLTDGITFDPALGSLPLRLLGAVHALVLGGAAPALAAHYPSTGGSPRWPQVFPAFVAVAQQHDDAIRRALAHPPQTNEVGRSAALVAGFLAIATATPLPLPLRLLELGASAGLNSRWPAYGYRLGELQVGDPHARVQVCPVWRGPAPPRAALHVHDRAACDLRPVDPRRRAARDGLLAWIWPEHTARVELLRQALAIAAADDFAVEAADAADWLGAGLALPAPPHTATVVFHSSVWNYLGPDTQRRLTATMTASGRARTEAAPLHWLRWEDPPGSAEHELRVQSWPHGEDRLLARGQPHAQWLGWLAPVSR